MTVTPQVARLKRKYGSEQVLVIKSADIVGIPDGYSPKKKLDDVTMNSIWNSHQFVYRYDAEYNYSLTQLIPYVVVTNESEDKLYIAERISGEERLRKQFQLGAGGHVNPCDMVGMDTITTAARREMNEELNIVLKEKSELEYCGTVRDLTSPTREHLGLVYLIHSDNVSIREENTLRGQWTDISGLITDYERFESWGRYIIDHLFQNYKTSGKLFS